MANPAPWDVDQFSEPGGLVKVRRTASGWFLSDLFVPKGERGGGQGTATVERVLAAAQAQRKPVELLCREDLVPFYERLGFVKIAGHALASRGEVPMRWQPKVTESRALRIVAAVLKSLCTSP